MLVFLVNYTGMGLALWTVWRARRRTDPALYRSALVWFWLQAGVGYAWSLLTYGFASIFLGFLLDLLDDALYAVTMLCFWRISRTAFLWLLPAACWFAFTTYLKWVMWQLSL